MTHISRPVQKKALLAVAFASSLLQPLQPALSENNSDVFDVTKTAAAYPSTKSVIEEIAHDTKATPEIRAYYLLRLAQDYLTNGADYSGEQLKNTFETYGKNRSNNEFFRSHRGTTMLGGFADGVLPSSMVSVNANSVAKIKTDHADSATIEAFKLSDLSTELFDKFYLHLIAARLFEKTGNQQELKKCNIAILRSCWQSAGTDTNKIQMLTSFLDSIAYGLVPITIPDIDPATRPFNPQIANVKAFTKKELKAGEAIKLQVITLVDRLDASSLVRRKAHRDLSLWYQKLGKSHLAENQKQILFQLVGRHDDSMMYATVVTCGALLWFPEPQKEIAGNEPKIIDERCGMG